MNMLLNIKAFLLTAKTGSFSAAAREMGVAPSVVTKRVTQLEAEIGSPLFNRTTRQLSLTNTGERLKPRFLSQITELEETIHAAAVHDNEIEGSLRIRTPTTITSLYLGGLLSEFHARHPRINMDIMLWDRPVNPLEEGFDIAVSARPNSYPNVTDISLCSFPLVLCSAPAYLDRKGRPQHPTDLIEFDCLSSLLLGRVWTFEGPRGEISVEVYSRFNVNDNVVVLEAVRRGIGIAILPAYLIKDDLKAGRLVPLLQDYPVTRLWLKLLIPRIKMNKPAVRALTEFLQEQVREHPPGRSLS